MKHIDVYSVDTGVPIPKNHSNLPLYTLEVNESFVFPLDIRTSIQTIASKIKKETGKEFTVRKIDDTNGRVWRTK